MSETARCRDCGKVTAGDTIHTCSPTVSSPAGEGGWLTMTEDDVQATNGIYVSHRHLTGGQDRWRAEAHAQRERAERAEAATFEWHRKNLVAQRSVNLLRRQNRELRDLLEESLIMGERRIDNSEGAWSDLRARLAEIEGE